MGEEMRGAEEDTGWRKAIPEARDRLQSRTLVAVVGILLALETVGVARQGSFTWGERGFREPMFPAEIIGISVTFAGLVLFLRAATVAGALFGGMISFLLVGATASSQYTIVRSGLAPLALLFVLTFLATRAGRRVKVRAGLAEKRRGRSAAQVIANLSIAGLAVSTLGFEVVIGGGGCCRVPYYRVWVWPAMTLMCLAAMVEATADTVSSEIGQAFGGRPAMLLTLQRVDPGADGAVTLLGSLAGIAGGAFVAVVGMWALRLRPSQAAIALFAGICGLFFDSFLGATMERRGWIGNDLVNFSSTLFAAGVAAVVLWLCLMDPTYFRAAW
ncbi:MAG TPA: DUF92 domain-containing protein [Edaphobacter sp.]|jgi:uncharacterized protein (TIGR00297 family)